MNSLSPVQELAVGSSLPCGIDDCAYTLLNHDCEHIRICGEYAIAIYVLQGSGS